MSNLQPANYLTSSRYFDGEVKYKVIRTNGRELLLENDLCRSLVVGQRLAVDDKVYALVTRVENELALAVMTEVRSPAYLTLSDWTPLALPRSKLLINESQAGKLYVRCSNSLTEKPGYIGWSLYDSGRNLVAIGNDYESHNVCQIAGTGTWTSPAYILEVRSFLPDSLQPINFGTKSWYLASPTSMLSVGALNDGQTNLILS